MLSRQVIVWWLLNIAAGASPEWRWCWRGTRETPASGMQCQNALIYSKCYQSNTKYQSILFIYLFSTCMMFSGEESCTCQQRGNEATPQWLSEASQRSVYKQHIYCLFICCSNVLTVLLLLVFFPVKDFLFLDNEMHCSHFKRGVSSLPCYWDRFFFFPNMFVCLHRVHTWPALPHPRAQDHRPVL